MRRLFLLLGLLVALATSSFLTGPATAASRADHPVPYTFLPSAVVGGAQTDPPGANDWSCQPTRRHPRPVVLVHGTFGNKSTNWQTYAPLLANEGYCVFALTYGVDPTGIPGTELFGGMTRMQDSARELKTFVAKVRRPVPQRVGVHEEDAQRRREGAGRGVHQHHDRVRPARGALHQRP